VLYPCSQIISVPFHLPVHIANDGFHKLSSTLTVSINYRLKTFNVDRSTTSVYLYYYCSFYGILI